MSICIYIGSALFASYNGRKLQTLKNSDGYNFIYPYIFTLATFLGESLAFIPMLFNSHNYTQMHITRYFIPALFDLLSSLCNNAAILFVASTVHGFFSNFGLLFAYILSKSFTNRRYNKRQNLGISVIMVGVVMIALNSLDVDTSNSLFSHTSVIGILLTILAEIFAYAQTVYEEMSLTVHHADPCKNVAVQGLAGLLMLILLLPVLSYIPCTPIEIGEGSVLYRNGYFVDFSGLLSDAMENKEIQYLLCLGVLAAGIFNIAAQYATYYIGTFNKAIFAQVRSEILWVIYAYLGWGKYSHFQLIGSIILFTGVSYYYEHSHAD